MSGSCFQESKRIVKCCSLMVCIVCSLSELYAGNVPVQTDLSPYWTIAANTNVIKSLGSDELVGSWKAHRYYIRRDTKDSKPLTAMGESTELFTLGQDGRANGVINIKDYRRKKYSGTWSYTNEVLLLPPQSVGSTNSIAYKVVWRTPDEIELRFVDLVYSRDGLEHHGVYDADGNLFVHCKTTSKSGEATTTELVQSVGIFKRQQNLK